MPASLLVAQESESSGSSIVPLLFIVMIVAVVYFIMIRPQRKRMRDQQAMQSAIGVGDEVVTNAGIYGFITGVDGDKFWLEIDDDVQIRIAKAAIQSRVNATADKDEKSEKPEKADKPADGNAGGDASDAS